MQLNQIVRDVSSHGIMQTARARVAASAQVFNLFENHYSDRFKAIVRELTANAIDAQRGGPNNDPVHVYLPDSFDPYFRVKDTGIGMSHEFCMTNFMEYSNGSTKSGNNNDIGGFGIGSKSPFSYTDQFTLRSVHNGTCSVYSVYKDEDGFPCIGLMEQTSTDEINGVEFSLPVEPSDFGKFVTAAKHLAYFLPEVALHGAPLDPVEYVQQGTGWGIRPQSFGQAPQVVMGGMAYPINRYSLDHPTYEDSLMQIPLDLILPIGSCTITPSREALLYDEKTKAAITEVVGRITAEVTQDMPTMFDHIASPWQAAVALSEHLGTDRNNAWSRLVLKHVQWHGQPLDLFFKVKADSIWHIEARSTRRKRGYSSAKVGSPSWGYGETQIDPSKITQIIIDDLPPHKSPVARLRRYIDEDCEESDQFLVIRGLRPEDLGGAPEDLIIRTSELPEIVRTPRFSKNGSNYVRPRVRMFKPTVYFDATKRASPVTWSSPVEEICYADQPTTGILVVMENFELPAGFNEKFSAGLIDEQEIHLVNRGDAPKLADAWEMFDDVFEQRLADTLAELPNAPQWKALMLSPLSEMIKFVRENPGMFDSVPKNTPFARLMGLIRTYETNIPYGLAKYIVPAMPPRVDPAELLARIENTHWKMLTLKNTCGRTFIPTDSNLFKLFKEII